MLKIKDAVERVKYDALKENLLRDLLYEILPAYKIKIFEETGKTRIVYEVPGVGRYRFFIYTHANGIPSVFKAMPWHPVSIENRGLSLVIIKLTQIREGFGIVSGTKDSGKTTTIASMIDKINQTRGAHIVIIEDQFEYVHTAYG